MQEWLDFRYSLPKAPEGPLIEITCAEAEKSLLTKLEKEKDNPTDALWQLARFYQQQGEIDKGLVCLRQTLAQMPDIESKASCILGMGQLMESAQDYEAAVRCYKEAFALEPTDTSVWYFINNNLGYSLNMLGRFDEGEKYCRAALTVDPNRPNAHKNLGIALAGQGDFRGAAESFVAATQANAADSRALGLLKKLLTDHPELEYDFQNDLAACEKAVEVVNTEKMKHSPVIVRGWRKQLRLLRMKLRCIFRKESV